MANTKIPNCSQNHVSNTVVHLCGFYPAFKDSRSAERGIVRFVIATQIIEAIVLRELVSVVITDRLC